MLKLLRRSSKGGETRTEAAQRSKGLSFFDLPPELRNAIYDLVIEGTTLTLLTKKAKRAPTPSMLLVSRRVRAEYQPVLLTRARIVANVFNYDFRDISSMASSLYSSQLKLLRLNDRLIIKVHCLRCRKQDLDSLRRWLASRANSLDRLPWEYEVGWSGSSIPLSAKPDMLLGHLQMLLEMKEHMRLDERLGYELLPLCQGIQGELVAVRAQLEDERSKSTT